MKKISVLILSILVSGCVAKSPEYHFYTMPDTTTTIQSLANNDTKIDIATVRLPEYLDRPHIVTTNGVQVDVHQSERWVEDLSSIIGRKVISNISEYLPNSSVRNAMLLSESADKIIFIEIYKMDGNLGGSVQMDALYSIMSNDEKSYSKTVHYTEHTGGDFASYVAACGALTDKLSRDISQSLVDMK